MPRSLYVHVPFCAHRCGYCDFVTTTRQPELHGRYVDALAREFDLRRGELGAQHDARFDTIFVGGGTPTLLEPAALAQLLAWLGQRAAPGAEVTIECNPETVTAELAQLLASAPVTRVSLGAQSFSPHVLHTLERRATPDTVRDAVATLRAAGVDDLNLDVIWGVPRQSLDDLAHDLRELVALAPDHVSAYELEFKPGTRLTHAFGTVDAAVGEASDDFYDTVVEQLTTAGFEWYETANFAREGRRCRHNLAYWEQRDYLGIGVGAVGTVQARRRTNLPNLPRYLAAVEAGELPPARVEPLDEHTRRTERVMLALRLARPLTFDERDLDDLLDRAWIERFDAGGMLTRPSSDSIELTPRGRMMLNGVLSRLLV